jgi:predicted transcriptional regulator
MPSRRIPQWKHDENRRKNHFQVRLDDDLAEKLRHFMTSRDYNANQALTTILSRFFKGQTNV